MNFYCVCREWTPCWVMVGATLCDGWCNVGLWLMQCWVMVGEMLGHGWCNVGSWLAMLGDGWHNVG